MAFKNSKVNHSDIKESDKKPFYIEGVNVKGQLISGIVNCVAVKKLIAVLEEKGIKVKSVRSGKNDSSVQTNQPAVVGKVSEKVKPQNKSLAEPEVKKSFYIEGNNLKGQLVQGVVNCVAVKKLKKILALKGIQVKSISETETEAETEMGVNAGLQSSSVQKKQPVVVKPKKTFHNPLKNKLFYFFNQLKKTIVQVFYSVFSKAKVVFATIQEKTQPDNSTPKDFKSQKTSFFIEGVDALGRPIQGIIRCMNERKLVGVMKQKGIKVIRLKRKYQYLILEKWRWKIASSLAIGFSVVVILITSKQVAQVTEIISKKMIEPLSVKNIKIKKHHRGFEQHLLISSIQQQAMAGDMNSQYRLASYHERGGVVDKSPKKAFENFLKAAKSGHVKSQYKVAEYYLFGQTPVSRDYDEALRWLYHSANGGNVNAMNKLAKMHFNGDKNDQKIATHWLKQSMNLGDKWAGNRYSSVNQKSDHAEKATEKFLTTSRLFAENQQLILEIQQTNSEQEKQALVQSLSKKINLKESID